MLNLKANIWDDEGLSLLLTCLLHFCSLAYFLLLSKLYNQHNNINYREFYSGIGRTSLHVFMYRLLPISVLMCVTTLIFEHAHFELICINLLELISNIFLPKVFLVLHATVGVSKIHKCIKTRTDTYAHDRKWFQSQSMHQWIHFRFFHNVLSGSFHLWPCAYLTV